MDQKKSIGISACLLGHRVRYDGTQKTNELIQRLDAHFKVIPVCPEMEIGLGVPREKILLQYQGNKTRLMTSCQPSTDLTQKMIFFAYSFLNNNVISGMILKDKSPSCGIENCKLYEQSVIIRHNGTGIFAATILQLKPDLPMLQSDVVVLPGDLDNFIQQVYEY